MRAIASKARPQHVSKLMADARCTSRILRIERKARVIDAEKAHETLMMLMAVVKLQAAFRYGHGVEMYR
jgi:hypothetical protein